MERIILQRNVLAGFMLTARHTTRYNRMVVHLASYNMCRHGIIVASKLYKLEFNKLIYSYKRENTQFEDRAQCEVEDM